MDSGGRDEKLVLNSLVSRDGTSRYRGRNVMAFCLRRAYFFTSSKVVPQVIAPVLVIGTGVFCCLKNF
ncbi:hypothetical protein D7X25_11960 [bacterium 1XD42-8]|nr:hypothetical protein D7X25_11960 [bacterium 1XD42-8]